MKKLSDYKPLQRINLPGTSDALRTDGLVLIVGPNSSGKTLFLKDIHTSLCGDARDIIVASKIFITKPPFEELLNTLIHEGYFKLVGDSNNPNLQPRTTYSGSGKPIETINKSTASEWYRAFFHSPDHNQAQRQKFLNHFVRLMVTALFIDRRLKSSNEVGVIDYIEQAPQDELHELILDRKKQEKFSDEIAKSFRKAIWVDSSRGIKIRLKVKDGMSPSEEEKHSPTEMDEYRGIGEEGDGLKSYVAICISLLLGNRPVCLIDEPEMCLHPPQAMNLGRFIGKNGASRDTVTFVATHSSHVLRGVIQETSDVQIVRLTRNSNSFVAHHVSPDVLSNAITKPAVRAETILDGIFAESAIIVESDGDRIVYQTIWQKLSDQLKQDVHFTAVGGNAGIPEALKLYTKLKIPVAVIADLDTMTNLDLLERILNARCSSDLVEELMILANSIMKSIQKLPPCTTENEAKTRLRELYESDWKWSEEGDVKLSKALNIISNDLKRNRRLKNGGINAYRDENEIHEQLNDLVSQLKTHGIYLVPVGELEDWLADKNIDASKSKKAEWANAAAIYIESNDTETGDVWGFISEVGNYLNPS